MCIWTLIFAAPAFDLLCSQKVIAIFFVYTVVLSLFGIGLFAKIIESHDNYVKTHSVSFATKK